MAVRPLFIIQNFEIAILQEWNNSRQILTDNFIESTENSMCHFYLFKKATFHIYYIESVLNSTFFIIQMYTNCCHKLSFHVYLSFQWLKACNFCASFFTELRIDTLSILCPCTATSQRSLKVFPCFPNFLAVFSCNIVLHI